MVRIRIIARASRTLTKAERLAKVVQELEHHQQIGQGVAGELQAGQPLQLREELVIGQLRVLARLAQLGENFGVTLADGNALLAAQQAVEHQLNGDA